MFLVQKFANAVRLKMGRDPLIITTSTGVMDVETSSPLLSLITKKDTTQHERLPAYFRAVATEGLRHPRQQTWDVNVHINKGEYKEKVLKRVSYEKMLNFMRKREFETAAQAGFSGSEAEIAAQRKAVVPATNILRFI